ncbi:FkbM family methyltransferase [Rhodopirellula baltica]
MKISILEKLIQKVQFISQTVIATLRGYIQVDFLKNRIRFAKGSHVPTGHFCLPRKTCRNRIVRDTDYVQQLALSAFFESHPSANVFVDIGAFHGYFALPLGALLKKRDGCVIAVEPDPCSLAKLRDSVQLNDLGATISCVPVAVSNEPGRLNLRQASSQSVLEPYPSGKGVDVEVKTLEQILDEHKIEDVDCLMVDVEGAELRVLQGTPKNVLLQAELFVEMHPYAWPNFGYTAQDFDAWLAKENLVCIDMFHRIHKQFAGDPWAPEYIGPTKLVHRSRL